MADAGSEIDTDALGSLLAADLGSEVTGFEVVADGINLMVAVETADDRYLLRRPNKLRNTGLFNGVDREYELLERLQGTGIPAPEPVAFYGDVVEVPCFVVTYLEGETVPLGEALPERFRTPEGRRTLAYALVDTLAGIHRLDVERFGEVCPRQTPTEQVERATERLDEATAVTGREFPRLRTVGDWLRENAPSEPEMTLVHGDFRPGNVLFSGTERPRVAGVIDWETAMLGDPRTEVGYLLLRWRDEGDPTPSLEEFETRYPNAEVLRELRKTNREGLAPFTARDGSPSRAELIARYEERTGIGVENERFYRAHAGFMLAAVWADLHRYRIEAGEESDREPYIEYMTRVAEGIVNREM